MSVTTPPPVRLSPADRVPPQAARGTGATTGGPRPSAARRAAQLRRTAYAGRVRRMRLRVALAAFLGFSLLWAVICVRLVTGHDPALAAHRVRPVVTSAVAQNETAAARRRAQASAAARTRAAARARARERAAARRSAARRAAAHRAAAHRAAARHAAAVSAASTTTSSPAASSTAATGSTGATSSSGVAASSGSTSSSGSSSSSGSTQSSGAGTSAVTSGQS